MKKLIAHIDPVQKYVSEEHDFSMYLGGPSGEAGVAIADDALQVLQSIPLFQEHVACGLIVIKDGD